MLINCSRCSARVDGKPEKLFPVTSVEGEQGYQVSLLECPACHEPVVGVQALVEYNPLPSFGEAEYTWSEAERVWPHPEQFFDPSIPDTVHVSLKEARACLVHGCHTASVVMSGRALEAVARHFHVDGNAEKLMLAKGLQELRENGKIDQRLYDWGKELHEHRNLAAHASERTFSREDAEDLFEFVNAICEYLFVLQDRYERFMKRKNAAQPKVDAIYAE